MISLDSESARLTRTLQRIGEPNSRVHAVLLYGIEGAPIQRYADALMQHWLCPNATPEGPCDQCPVCRSAREHNATDAQIFRPTGPSAIMRLYVINGQPKIPDDDPIVPVRSFFRTKPTMARTKVVTLHDFDRANNDAANALLKTLEEPAGFAKIILTTTALSRILPTIRSRCVCLSVPWDTPLSTHPLPDSWKRRVDLGENPELLTGLQDILNEFKSQPPAAALRLSEELRAWAKDYQAQRKTLSARTAQTETLRLIADWIHDHRPEAAQLQQSTVEAHALVTGNVNATFVFDSWAYLYLKAAEGTNL